MATNGGWTAGAQRPTGQEKGRFVEGLLPMARERLVTIIEDAPLSQAAGLLATRTDLVVGCSPAGLLSGVITKTDIVRQIAQLQGVGAAVAGSSVMVRDVVLCRSGETLISIWTRMKERKLKNVPFVDRASRPLGVLPARGLLRVLLQDSENDEAMLRDCVMAVGYPLMARS